jgi:hypothetical protein
MVVLARACRKPSRDRATSMMSQLGWEELRLRRARIKTILLFKIVNNLVDIPPEPFLIPTGAITRGQNISFLDVSP